MEVIENKKTANKDQSLIEYHLVYINERRKRRVKLQNFGIGRHIIGRIANSDFQIKAKKVSAVHAVLEVREDYINIFDMNSTNGTFVNDERIVHAQVKVDDIISFAGIKFRVVKAGKPILPEATPLFEPKKIVEHPLSASAMPSFENTEYIFEDQDNIYPIFDYNVKPSFEVTVIHQDNVVSIDYIDASQNQIFFTGNDSQESENHIFFSYIVSKTKHLLIEKNSKDFNIHNIEGFNITSLTKMGVKDITDSKVEFLLDDILCLQKDNIEIYIRMSDAPPVIAAAPIFRRDAFVHRFLIPTVLAIFIPLLILSFLTIEPEEKKEKKIERIATIIFNKKIDGKVAAKSPVSSQGLKSTTKEKRKQNVKGKLAKGKTSKKVKTTVIKENQKITKKLKGQKTTKKTTRTTSRAKSSKIRGFKNLDFKSSLNQLLVSQNKLGKTSDGTDKQSDQTKSAGLKLNDSGESNLKQIGDTGTSKVFEGASKEFATSVGAEGLSDKKSLYTIGLSGNDVVRGSVNGSDVIDKLRQHQSQIRHCVEVNKRPGQTSDGIMELKFKIAASGYVPQRSLFIPTKSYNLGTKKCIGNVVRGIRFTPPVDGSTSNQSVTLNLRDL